MKRYKNYFINLICPAFVFGSITGILTSVVVTLYKVCASLVIKYSQLGYGFVREHLYIAPLVLIALFMPEGPWMLVAILTLCAVFLVPCFYALKLEVSVGAYKCKKCGHEIVPTYSEALWAMHSGTTRYLKCPKCNKRTWCKKVLKR